MKNHTHKRVNGFYFYLICVTEIQIREETNKDEISRILEKCRQISANKNLKSDLKNSKGQTRYGDS